MRPKAGLAMALLALSAFVAFAQVPRQKPILPGPPTPVPTPVPTPGLPQPIGTFSENVTGSITGSGTTGNHLLGTWVLRIPSTRCNDCDPGQSDLSGGTYQGMTYATGAQETGVIYGFVNPSGRVIGFNLLATNCSTINPSNTRVANPGIYPYGYYYGGQTGENPGSTITFGKFDLGFGLSNYAYAGRISGRDCFNQIIVADVRLFRQ